VPTFHPAYLLRNPALDVRVVRVIRDGRGVALTHTNPAAFADAADSRFHRSAMGGHNPTPMNMTDAAWLWRRSVEESEHLVAALGAGRCIDVRYEQLCLDPAGVLGGVHDFLGVPRSALVTKARDHHVIGNGMRFDSRPVSLDERWRQVLTREQLRAFDAVGGALNRRLGYER